MAWKDFMAKSFQLEDVRKAIIDELEAFQCEQRKRQILEITTDDVDEVMKIIQKEGARKVRVRGAHGNSARAKRRTCAEFDFIHRKDIISMNVLLTVEPVEKVREGKNISVKEINYIKFLFNYFPWGFNFFPFDYQPKDIDNTFPWNDHMSRIYGERRFRKIKDYILHRRIRESLRKAKKCGIDVSDLREDGVKSSDFKSPCLLLVEIIDKEMIAKKKRKKLLYTPFGKLEYKGNAFSAGGAFKDLTGARHVPTGKDAMERIEALMIQTLI
ncbi:hypothetical protein [Thermicanus aegyptius]|uniref:hypothetical protein n=1 Tax=Thermicanus aegyptius TaxID=94009 RepID=UPI00041039A7|nr:hypothetical protein [Thermicanus aegyptius]